MCQGKKSCWNCKNGEFVKGYADTRWEPGEPDSVECRASFTEMELEVLDIEDRWEEFAHNAHDCHKYIPQVFETCRNCGKPINKNKYDYPKELLYYGAFDDKESAMCSAECKTEYQNKETKYIEEQEELERQALEDYQKMKTR